MADDDIQEPPIGSGPAQAAPFLRSQGESLDPTKSNWCGAFTNALLKKSGITGLSNGGQIASNWQNYGAPVTDSVQPNDVLVIPRGRQPGQLGSHVGVATGATRINPANGQPEVQMKSGNDDGNKVGVDWVPASQIVARRGTQMADANLSAEDLKAQVTQLRGGTSAPGGSSGGQAAQQPSADDLKAQVAALRGPSQTTTAAPGGRYGPQAQDWGIPGRPLPAGPPPPPATAGDAVGDYLGQGAANVGSAIAQGWRQSALAPGAERALESLPYVGGPLGLLSRGAGAVVGGAGGVFGEVQRGLAGAGNALIPPNAYGPIGPSLAAGLEVLPAAGMPGFKGPMDVRGAIAQARAPDVPVRPTSSTPPPPQRLSVGPEPAPDAASAAASPAATSAAPTGTWRPVQPGEVFQPGRSYQMDQTTGGRLVWEPPAAAAQAAVKTAWETLQQTAPSTPERSAAQKAFVAAQQDFIAARQVTSPPPTSTGAPATPAAPSAAPEPASVGAASRDTSAGPLPDPSRAQALANLERSVNQSAEDRAGPQQVDNTTYVGGIPPRPLASRVFNAQNALDEKAMRGADTAARDQIEAVERDRNQGMVDLLRKQAGDANTADTAREARREVAPDQYGAFKGEQPVDASGLLQTIDAAMNSPRAAKSSSITTALKSVRDSLFDADGNLETQPSRLYGARQNLTDLLDRSKGVGDEAKKLQAATVILTDLVPEFDSTIGGGAPRYSGYMNAYREASKEVNQQEFLQKYTEGTSGKKITGGDGYLIPNRVQGMLNDILQEQKKTGPNAAKSLTDEQIQNIINVRNELAASTLRDRRAAVRGSDTFQMLKREAEKGAGPLGTALRAGRDITIGGALAHVAGLDPMVNALVNTVGRGMIAPTMEAARAGKREAARSAAAEARTRELLRLGPTDNYLSQY